jgi:hypothetical protein
MILVPCHPCRRHMLSLCFLGCVNANWDHSASSETLSSWFDAEVELRYVAGFNRHKDPEVAYQSGGTGIVALNEISQYSKKLSNNFRVLGRFSWYSLDRLPSQRTRVISVCTVEKSKPAGALLIYQQHMRYMQTYDMDTIPYIFFCGDLLLRLETCLAQGDRIILTMDANVYVLKRKFTRDLCNLI